MSIHTLTEMHVPTSDLQLIEAVVWKSIKWNVQMWRLYVDEDRCREHHVFEQ